MNNRQNNNTGIIIAIVASISVLSLLVLILVGIIISSSKHKEEAPKAPSTWEPNVTLDKPETPEQPEEQKELSEEGKRPEIENKLDSITKDPEIPEIDNEYVFAGKKHWLFYKSTSDGDTMADYYATNDFSEKEMEKIASSLEKQRATIEEKGGKFVLLIVPNKEVVYDQFMAEEMIRPADTVSRTDKLVDYLKANTDLDVIYIKDKFLSMKDEEELIYYKTDTHWNMRGCYVAVDEIMNHLYGISKPIDQITFQEHMHDFSGDLVAKASLGTEYKVDTVYFLGADQVGEEQKVEDKLLLVGDSFAEFMKLEMEYYFKGGVVDGNVEKYKYNFFNATAANLGEEPNIVVWECCERHVGRLAQ